MAKNETLQDTAVGYNDADCMAIDQGIENVYSATITAIQNHIKDDIVAKVAENWYAEQATSYFQKFAGNCANAADDVKAVFQNFRDQMQQNITDWRTRTEMTSGTDLQTITEKTITIDVSAVKATDESGNRYISNNLETDLEGWITTCRTGITTDIGTAVADNVVGSFIGASQNENINTAMGNLATIIDGILNFLTTGNNSILTEITNYRSQYTTTATDNATHTNEKDYGEGADQNGGADDAGGN